MDNDVKQIAGELKETKEIDKALFCNFDVFKDIYRYETRQLERRGYSLVLMLLEIFCVKEKALAEELPPYAKEALNECCMQTLRKGDVFANYSETQTLVMLIVANVMDAAKVTNRLCERFNTGEFGGRVHLKAETQSSLQM